jgi:hypothetical protein
MTFSIRYTVVGHGKREPVSLYEACRQLVDIATAGEDHDGSHVSADHDLRAIGARPVAFYCNARNQVITMFGAHADEREMIVDDFGRPESF